MKDPLEILNALGAHWSPAFSRPGPLLITSADCVLCPGTRCQCRQCPEPYVNRFAGLLDGRTSGNGFGEPCGMTIDPATGQCPRGHGEDGGDAR